MLLQQNFPLDASSLLQLSLNIPGGEKQPAGSAELFTWARRELQAQLSPLTEIFSDRDCLGPWGLFSSPLAAAKAKSRAVQIEEHSDFARLLDLDVYDSAGQPCDRRQLGLAERHCLLCERPAKECIRRQRHNPLQLKARLEELLKPFTS
jgi:holo-ACP synthase CitX